MQVYADPSSHLFSAGAALHGGVGGFEAVRRSHACQNSPGLSSLAGGNLRSSELQMRSVLHNAVRNGLRSTVRALTCG